MVNAYLIKINKNNHINLNYLDESILFHCQNNETSLLSYFYLAKILKEEFDIKEIKIDFTSKPKLIGSSYHFNISHSKDYILIGISDEEIGVDIESKNKTLSGNLIKKTLSLNEKRVVNTNIDFLRCWVKKEAYLKYLGTGIDRRLNFVDSTKLNNAKLYEDEDVVFCVYSHQISVSIFKEKYEEN
ncbi:MAG: 4'-phosphopantetheinyl transferase superfamily protein [Bacilli bacterium]|nr:4'-phosphopantetheinyl transferase superfamily protein [Bacillales bacterium]MDY2574713.1 4'-phosphopantetheinyl transferase superfamily protein [Bacilli bacterium]